MSAARRTITIECIDKRGESTETKKTDDKSGWEKEVDVEEQEEVDIEEHGKTTDEPEDEPSMVEFKYPVYELSQTYEMEPEYESMTVEQEAAKV